jgi:hypothetical protein
MGPDYRTAPECRQSQLPCSCSGPKASDFLPLRGHARSSPLEFEPVGNRAAAPYFPGVVTLPILAVVGNSIANAAAWAAASPRTLAFMLSPLYGRQSGISTPSIRAGVRNAESNGASGSLSRRWTLWNVLPVPWCLPHDLRTVPACVFTCANLFDFLPLKTGKALFFGAGLSRWSTQNRCLPAVTPAQAGAFAL